MPMYKYLFWNLRFHIAVFNILLIWQLTCISLLPCTKDMAVSQIPLYRTYTRNLKIETRVGNPTASLYDHEILRRLTNQN